MGARRRGLILASPEKKAVAPVWHADQARTVLDALNTAVLTCDAGLDVTALNPAAEMLFGVSANQVIGKPFAGLILDGADRVVAPLYKALISGRSVTAHDFRLDISPGKTATVDITVTPIPMARGDDRLIVELMQVDHFKRLAYEESRVDRHAANRAVLRGLAHEIKNPLGGLRGAAQLLDRELPDRTHREYTRVIIHEADRLRNLVDRMMGSYRPIQSTQVNIHQVLEHVRKLLLVEVREGVSIEVDYDPSLPDLLGDSEQLIQAVLNIARNSVEALQRRGEIVLRTRVGRSVYIGKKWHRKVIRVDIADNGPGIPEDMQERIFYPMVTGRPDGSGLGLSIAQDIIVKHGGLIKLHSRPGHTVFSIFLPLDEEDKQHD
jgi:two-component system nitrogen regulation sensor histidine kinase GlnL